LKRHPVSRLDQTILKNARSKTYPRSARKREGYVGRTAEGGAVRRGEGGPKQLGTHSPQVRYPGGARPQHFFAVLGAFL